MKFKVGVIVFIAIFSFLNFAVATEDSWDSTKNCWTKIMLSTYEKNIVEIKNLIESGHDVNQRINCPYEEVRTALDVGIRIQDVGVVEYLLEMGANSDDHAYSTRLPLMFASRFGCVDIVKLLLEYGANINNKTDNGSTALMEAAVAEGDSSIEIMEMLIDNGADVNVQADINGGGYTALMYSAYAGSSKKTKLLLQKGANPHLKNGNMMTAFDINESILKWAINKNKKNEIEERKLIQEMLEKYSQRTGNPGLPAFHL